MKIHRLSTTAERISAVCICSVLLLCMVFLVIALSADVLSFMICLLASLLVAAGLVFYVVNLFKSGCIAHGADRKLEVKGFPDYTVDLHDAVSVRTAAYKNGPGATRTIVFTNAQEEVVASVSTFFTVNQGAQAEPLAMALAEELGLAFHATLEDWEYDPVKRKQHQKEQAAKEKAQRKEKFRALKAKFLRMTGAGEPAPIHPEEEEADMDMDMNEEPEESKTGGINYDALDDIR